MPSEQNPRSRTGRGSAHLLLVSSVVAAGLASARPAMAQIVAANTLGSCLIDSGGIGETLGNVGAQHIPRDVGFQFSAPALGRYQLDDITVCVRAQDANHVASFVVYTDVFGAPGWIVDSFDVPISTDKGFASAEANQGAILSPGLLYWLIAQRGPDQGAWWRLDPTEQQPRATLRDDDGAWEVGLANVSQMRVRVAPEPTGAASALAAGVGLWLRRRLATRSRMEVVERCASASLS